MREWDVDARAFEYPVSYERYMLGWKLLRGGTVTETRKGIWCSEKDERPSASLCLILPEHNLQLVGTGRLLEAAGRQVEKSFYYEPSEQRAMWNATKMWSVDCACRFRYAGGVTADWIFNVASAHNFSCGSKVPHWASCMTWRKLCVHDMKSRRHCKLPCFSVSTRRGTLMRALCSGHPTERPFLGRKTT